MCTADAALRSVGAQNAQHILELGTKLSHQLLRLRVIVACSLPCQILPGTADGVALRIQQTSDLTNQHDIVALVIAAVTAPFYDAPV